MPIYGPILGYLSKGCPESILDALKGVQEDILSRGSQDPLKKCPKTGDFFGSKPGCIEVSKHRKFAQKPLFL
jgi:hypothetical protein